MSTLVTDSIDTEILRYLWTPDLDPVFWREGRAGVLSAWYGHIPFAHWIVGVLKPRTVVELGTQHGVSYSAFCEAVLRNGLNSRCYAVDTWKGDDQAGHYGEDVYWDFRRFNDARYNAFSELLRCTFDGALAYISDASVDLLHIDGFHTYEAVRHDFENWRNKLSDSAVVLFHDTNVRERDFGVWRLWEELRIQFPSFEFLHGHGLGLLATGSSISAEVAALCSLTDPARVSAVRQRFSLLGERWILLNQVEEVKLQQVAVREEQAAEVAARESRIQSIEAEAARRLAAETQLRAQAVQRAKQARAETAKAIAAVESAPLIDTRHDVAFATIDETESVCLYERLEGNLDTIRKKQKDKFAPLPREILRLEDPEEEIRKFALPGCENPTVSILIPVYNELAYTAECIGSVLRSQPKVSYELIIADDASSDPSIASLGRIKNIRYLVQPFNVGFLENCNLASDACRGKYVLLLNNDVQLMPGALDALVDVLELNRDVAAVGPKILYPDGRLQEAGCTIDRDGVSTMVGLFADPDQPCFNYMRDVHYCSGAAFLVRRSEIGEVMFDKTFMPAYCEDVDLCLRLLSRGCRIVYCPGAEVVHHLSASTNKQSVTKRLQLVGRNQQKLVRKWPELLEVLNKARVIAFYLPQFHTTPENDFNWGQGFTEWTNVAKATPRYVGHYQPRLPADLGFYDLRVKQTFERQVALARRYGVSGFCVYYYNLGARRALDEAFEAMVADQTIDFPYCVCWANENWTRHWDGGNRAMIFEQSYDRETLLSIVRDATRYAADPRYIRVNGRPMFLIYRPLLIPDVQAFAALCRDTFRSAGFGELHLVFVESMETATKSVTPAELGFDACVEFPPHGCAVSMSVPPDPLHDRFAGPRYDYEASVLENLGRPVAGYKRYPAVFPSWDNTPRHPLYGHSFVGASPEVFQVFVEEKLDELRRMFVGDERMLFVNAWNEWAEGAHLEPDRKFGHRWLEAIRNALMVKSLA